MAPVPTVSRIFADQYRREATRLEKLHANHLAPGTTTWGAAMQAMEDRVGRLPGPIKRTTAIRNAAIYLRENQKDSMHFMLGLYTRKRSSAMSFGTINFGTHPLAGVSEDGVSVMRHTMLCRRDGGGGSKVNQSMAYISRHAVQRLHERGRELTIETATKMFTAIGMLGFMLSFDTRHIDKAMCLRLNEDMLAVGVVRFAVGTGCDIDQSCTFFEVRTFLPLNELDSRPTQRRQGEAAFNAVCEWVKGDRDVESSKALSEKIPTLEWREHDFIQQTAVKISRESAHG
jgi:hypothetical protein